MLSDRDRISQMDERIRDIPGVVDAAIALANRQHRFPTEYADITASTPRQHNPGCTGEFQLVVRHLGIQDHPGMVTAFGLSHQRGRDLNLSPVEWAEMVDIHDNFAHI